MILPNDIKVIFYETLNGDRSVLEFEQWLYANRQLEEMMLPEDYMDLIAFGYKDKKWAKDGLFTLLGKHVRDDEFKLWKLMRKKYPQGYTHAFIKTPFDEQLQRIKQKLVLAKSVEEERWGPEAEEHEYLLNVPALEEEVSAFEHKHSIQLPEDYRAFLLVVGNGGIGSYASGAGPYYGLYPLGHDSLFKENDLNSDCLAYPEMSEEQWEEYKKKAGETYSGMLSLGSQGCTYEHAIVLNGPYRGQIVNLDYNFIVPPVFSPVPRFLDWYEQWLDAVIDGSLENSKTLYGFPQY